jgi:glutathione S-transferase
MKLHWSPRSPYVRKVMMVAHEIALVDKIETVRSVAIRTRPNPDIIQDSPIGRIPVMVLDDGIVLSGSFAICDYLDSLHDGRKMIPQSGIERWRELELHGIADGLLDTLIFWRGELMVPVEQCRQDISETCAVKVEACLDWLENKVGVFSKYDFAIGQITVGIALEYMDFRYGHIDWRASRPELTAWHLNFSQRDSRKATEVVNDE